MVRQELLNLRKDCIEYQTCINERLNDVASPLHHLNIQWFGYGRFYLDEQQQCDTFFWANTHLESFQWYCLNALDNGPDFTEAIRQTQLGETNYFTVSLNTNDYIINAFQELYSFLAGISVYRRHPTYVELWDFSTTQTDSLISAALNFSKLQLLSRYINFFNDKLPALDLDERNSIKFPTKLNMAPYEKIYNFDKFLEVTELNRKSLIVQGKLITISKREWECLYMLAGGKTMKEAAKSLWLSPRTVESYLNNLKIKTGYNTKSDLIKMYLDNSASFDTPA